MNVTVETETSFTLGHRIERLLEDEYGRWTATCSCGDRHGSLTAEGAARTWNDHLVQAICDESIASRHRREVLDQAVAAYDGLPVPRERSSRGQWLKQGVAA